MSNNNAKRWDTLRRSLRVCHDAVDSGLTELQNIAKIAATVSPAAPDTDILSELGNTKKSVQENLRQASQIIDEMLRISSGDAIKSAQLSRFEAVTENYSREFQQATQAVEQKVERRKLLARPSILGSPYDVESGSINEQQQQLLREKDTITSSLDLLRNVMTQGRESLNSLTRQQDQFVGVNRTLHQLTNKFPSLRSVMSRIHRAKLKQTIVLAVIVASCILFMVWYSFR